MSAMSQLTLSNGIFAAKAFAIATLLVAVGGGVLVLGVKTALGVNEVSLRFVDCPFVISLTLIPCRPVNSGPRCDPSSGQYGRH
jgi:hypothetical protein